MKLNFRSNPLSAALLLVFLFFCSTGAVAAEAEDEHIEAEEGHADSVIIEPGMAEQAGITTAVAGPGIIREAITVYGRTIIDPQGISQIRARFPGMVVAI